MLTRVTVPDDVAGNEIVVSEISDPPESFHWIANVPVIANDAGFT
jgi:hypothetical protein